MPRATNPKPPDSLTGLLDGTAYRVARLIRTGGMCEVYEAESEGAVYAVKLLRREYAASEQIRDRMRIDAEVPIRIREQRGSPHPNIVNVHSFGENREGRPFVVMDRLRGHTLHYEISQRGALPPLEAIRYVLDALRGVSAAHQLGVVHRDLTPSNLFLCRHEHSTRSLKVIDFGYAKVVSTHAHGAFVQPLVISTDSFVGTHRWAAPEQSRPETAKFIDARADLYTLGLVLYTLLCGRVPFRDLNRRAELLRAQVAKTMDPLSAETVRRISSELAQIMATALAKDRDQRFASAETFMSALEELEEQYVARHSTDRHSEFPLTAKQHAQMTAELELYPEHRAAIRDRYGVSSDAAWSAAQTAWERKIATDPVLQQKWKKEVARHRAHLLTSLETANE